MKTVARWELNLDKISQMAGYASVLLIGVLSLFRARYVRTRVPPANWSI